MYKPTFSSTAAGMSRLGQSAYPESVSQTANQPDLFEDLNLYRPAPALRNRPLPLTPQQTAISRAQMLMRTLQPDNPVEQGYISDYEEDYPTLATGTINPTELYNLLAQGREGILNRVIAPRTTPQLLMQNALNSFNSEPNSASFVGQVTPLTSAQRQQGLGNIPRSPARGNLYQSLQNARQGSQSAQSADSITPCKKCQLSFNYSMG